MVFEVAVIDDRTVLDLQSHLNCQKVVDLVIGNQPAVVAIDSLGSCAPEGQTARDGELRPAKCAAGI